MTHPKLEGKFNAKEARERWIILQADPNSSSSVTSILPLLDEWSYSDGGRLKVVKCGVILF